MQNDPIINILTRTASRPNYSRHCRASILNQTYCNTNHILGIDDIKSLDYIDEYYYSNDNIVRLDRQTKQNINHAPYNLYLNTMLRIVKDGWVIILDDDDKFMKNDALEILVPYMNNERNLLLWKVQFPGYTIPGAAYFGMRPVSCNISMIGFCFHISQLNNTKFNDAQTGDFTFINELYNKLNPVWINDILTGLQRTNSAGGFGSLIDLQE